MYIIVPTAVAVNLFFAKKVSDRLPVVPMPRCLSLLNFFFKQDLTCWILWMTGTWGFAPIPTVPFTSLSRSSATFIGVKGKVLATANRLTGVGSEPFWGCRSTAWNQQCQRDNNELDHLFLIHSPALLRSCPAPLTAPPTVPQAVSANAVRIIVISFICAFQICLDSYTVLSDWQRVNEFEQPQTFRPNHRCPNPRPWGSSDQPLDLPKSRSACRTLFHRCVCLAQRIYHRRWGVFEISYSI